VAHLQGLVSEWQLLADLSFSDLMLWVRETPGDNHDSVSTATGEWICVAQVRPTTGTTAHLDDMVTATAGEAEVALLERAWGSGDIVSDFELGEIDENGVPTKPLPAPLSHTHRREVIPVRLGDTVVAVTTRDTGRLVGR
jgi:two-component system, sensor histidine kinase PdtaS